MSRIGKIMAPKLSSILFSIVNLQVRACRKAGLDRDETWEKIRPKKDDDSFKACFDIIWPWEYDV